MRTPLKILIFTVACGCGAGNTGAPTQSPREEQSMTDKKTVDTDPAHRWNLGDLYPSEAAWEAAFDETKARLADLEGCAGLLSESAGLADCLDMYFDVGNQLTWLGSYAHMRLDENTKDPESLGLRQRAENLGTQFSEATSFIEPEILEIPADRLDGMVAAEPRLAVYRHYLDDITRLRPHTLDKKGEKIMAATGLISGAAGSIYGILTNADIPWPTVTLSDGTEARLDASGYTRYRSLPERADRKLVFDTFFAKYKEYEQTIGVALSANLQEDVFYTETRNYDNCLARAISGENVPEQVYRTLVEVTNAHLDTLHRYLRLRARMLGIEKLAYYDLYPPLVTAELTFPIDKGKALVIDALAPLGGDYVATVNQGFENRWMDVFPREGKRSGAYSNGSAYGVHPYVLMNYTDTYDAVTTLAHEWGHAMHSHLANTAQPLPTADYDIFMAEVASTFNEALLLDRMLKEAKTDEERLFYLGSALETLRGTFFRQTMFAEFELEIHELAEKREALTGARFSELYLELVRRYLGHDKGVATVDDAYAVEWAYIPHFYYNFYVYKYATSIAASALFAKQVLDGDAGARDRYLDALKAGGSRYSYELLRDAGVDLATPAPYEALMAQMNAIMDDIEKIIAE